MHGNVVALHPGQKETNVQQRCTVETVFIHLVDDPDLVSYSLSVEEGVHVRGKLEELLEAVSKGYNDCEFVWPPRRIISISICGHCGSSSWIFAHW